MTAPDNIWRRIVGKCNLSDDYEFDVRPVYGVPYSETWPYDGMAVDEELTDGCHVVRYFHKFTDDEPWVEVVFNAELN